jgi:hypothetical protein
MGFRKRSNNFHSNNIDGASLRGLKKVRRLRANNTVVEAVAALSYTAPLDIYNDETE